MTFFRYFPTKEDVVLSDSYDPLLVAAIQARPRTEDPVTRIRTAVREGLGAIYAAVRDALLVRVRLSLGTPALRARLWENQYATRDLLAGALEDGGPSFATRILASACLATLTTALEEWVATDGVAELPALIDEAFQALADGRRP
jgi:AcrR family transcriptional regulator